MAKKQNKKTKIKKATKSPKVNRVSFKNKAKKVAKKSLSKSGKVEKKSNSKKEIESKAEKLISKGKERGFVTYDEILKEFPNVEQDINFLDDLYSKLSTAGIDILEGGGLLEVEAPEPAPKKYSYGSRSSDSSYDSIQMYLKEIGQYPLISAGSEKDLAKRIQAGNGKQ
jgi:RNA polymerase primary sigma factor